MKKFALAAVFVLAGLGSALADAGVRCGPTGQFYGYGSAGSLGYACWAVEAFGSADANGTTQ